MLEKIRAWFAGEDQESKASESKDDAKVQKKDTDEQRRALRERLITDINEAKKSLAKSEAESLKYSESLKNLSKLPKTDLRRERISDLKKLKIQSVNHANSIIAYLDERSHELDTLDSLENPAAAPPTPLEQNFISAIAAALAAEESESNTSHTSNEEERGNEEKEAIRPILKQPNSPKTKPNKKVIFNDVPEVRTFDKQPEETAPESDHREAPESSTSSTLRALNEAEGEAENAGVSAHKNEKGHYQTVPGLLAQLGKPASEAVPNDLPFPQTTGAAKEKAHYSSIPASASTRVPDPDTLPGGSYDGLPKPASSSSAAIESVTTDESAPTATAPSAREYGPMPDKNSGLPENTESSRTPDPDTLPGGTYDGLPKPASSSSSAIEPVTTDESAPAVASPSTDEYGPMPPKPPRTRRRLLIQDDDEDSVESLAGNAAAPGAGGEVSNHAPLPGSAGSSEVVSEGSQDKKKGSTQVIVTELPLRFDDKGAIEKREIVNPESKETVRTQLSLSTESLNSSARTMNIFDTVQRAFETGSFEKQIIINGSDRTVLETLHAIYSLEPEYSGKIFYQSTKTPFPTNILNDVKGKAAKDQNLIECAAKIKMDGANKRSITMSP